MLGVATQLEDVLQVFGLDATNLSENYTPEDKHLLNFTYKTLTVV